MKIYLVFIINLIISSLSFAQSEVVIKVGNVIGDAPNGRMPLHTGLLQKQISEKIYKNTKGEINFEILPGKRPDIPVFIMPDMTAKGDVIQATIVLSLFLTRVPEILIQSIPFLFESDEHSRRFMNSEIDNWLSKKVFALDSLVDGVYRIEVKNEKREVVSSKSFKIVSETKRELVTF